MPELLPFNFEAMPSGKILISNDVGHFHVLPSRNKLEELVALNLDAPTITDLRAKLFLSDSPEETSGYVKLLASGLSSKYQAGLCHPGLFIVVPTLRCDHGCTYCQVSRVNENARGYDLDPKLIPKIVSTIKKFGQKPYKIEFQGGEPLLRFDIIKMLINQFLSSTDKDDVQFVIATSLSKISEDILLWTKDKPVHFSVSLDGNRFTHNKSRKHLIGSSYDMACSGIERITRTIGRDRVATVTTATKNLIKDFSQLIETHRDLGLSEIFVRPISPYGFATEKFDQYSTSEYLEFYGALLKHLIENYNSLGITEGSAKIHLRRIFDNKYNGYVDLKSPSGYVLGALVFDYSGNIFGSDEARMLHKTYNIQNLVLGNLHYGALQLPNNGASIEILASTFITETPGCRFCAYSPYCGTDPMHHLATQSDYIGNKSLSHFCRIQKGTFGLLFDLLDDVNLGSTLRTWAHA